MASVSYAVRLDLEAGAHRVDAAHVVEVGVEPVVARVRAAAAAARRRS